MVSEYQQRRASLMAQLPPDSVLVIPAASEVTRSNDTHYPFRQDSDFYYLTGVNEPDGVLVLKPGAEPAERLFVLPRDPQREIWEGKLLGTGQASEISGIRHCYPTTELAEQLPQLINHCEHLYTPPERQVRFTQQLQQVLTQLRAGHPRTHQAPVSLHDPTPLLSEMRLLKSPAEIDIMQAAADISVAAHLRAMRATRPGAFEYQVAAELHYEFARRGASGPAYPSICGGGENACILHYTSNGEALKDGDLLLIDAGAEYQGYAADITRTFPVNGTFSQPQRELYDWVLAAQNAALAELRPGATLQGAHEQSARVLIEGLLELKLLTGTVEENWQSGAYRQFYMHSLGHWLGLDVHDVGSMQQHGQPRPLQPGMVLTVEPGLYIAPDTPGAGDYAGTGIRLEDDVRITDQGYQLLSAGLPRTATEIEQYMAGEA